MVDDNDDGCWSICWSLLSLFGTISDDDEIDVIDSTVVVADDDVADAAAALLSSHLQKHSRSNSSVGDLEQLIVWCMGMGGVEWY